MPSRRVVRVLNELVAVHGCPSAVRVDNGPEFTAQPFVEWCAEHGVATHYIQPGKPDQNAYIERFNRSYRTEVLNAHLFDSPADLQTITDASLRTCNHERPQTALAGSRRSRFCRGHHPRRSLRMHCLLDGEAYGGRTSSRVLRKPARARGAAPGEARRLARPATAECDGGTGSVAPALDRSVAVQAQKRRAAPWLCVRGVDRARSAARRRARVANQSGVPRGNR